MNGIWHAADIANIIKKVHFRAFRLEATISHFYHETLHKFQ